MIVVGLTGGLGSGKSTIGSAFAARGALVIDTDEVAREVLAPGSPGERAVLEHFGAQVAGPDGSIDRPALARLVFSTAEELRALEVITHPLINAEVRKRAAAAHSGSKLPAAGQLPAADIVVIELPLIDAGSRHRYGLDVVVRVEAPEELAVRRAAMRGMDEEDARSRIAAQRARPQSSTEADWVLTNAGDRHHLDSEIEELLDWLGRLRPGQAVPGPR